MKSFLLTAVLAHSVNAVVEYDSEWNHPWYADDCWPRESPAVEDPSCPGAGEVAMTLDFANANVRENQLHRGGILWYENVGKVENQDIDLKVSVVPGTEYISSKGRRKNGIAGGFGRINLNTKRGQWESGQGSFRFCFHNHGSAEPTVIRSFRFSVFDMDERNNNPHGMKERIVVDATQFKDYFVAPSLDYSELRAWCTSQTEGPCTPDDPMIIHSSTYGNLNDNPTNPTILTARQQKRTFVMYFENTDCFDITFDQYCKLEEENNGSCSRYGSTDFLFAGDAPQVVAEGSCVSTRLEEPPPPTVSTPVPTVSPSSAPSESPTESTCVGKVEMETNLDFFNARLVQNDLENGGLIKYESIGVVRDRPVDLVVSVVPGTTYFSEKAQARNGLSGSFGQINLFTELGDLESGQGHFRFCFHDHETGDLTTADSFAFSVYDVDERNASPRGIKEKIIFDMSQATEYMLYPNADNTEIQVSCENPSETPPCPAGTRTVFHSSTRGTGSDNPDDPNNMTEQQKKRSIVFVFEDTECWDFTYEHYCRIEEEEGGTCEWYGGGNFLFAGTAQEIIEEGECLTNAPTIAPLLTDTPTTAPTTAPTTEPTFEPTASPTNGPTDDPTAYPTASPSAGPTSSPTSSPSESPSGSYFPSSDPTASPTKSPQPSESPTSTPTTSPTAIPTASPTSNPTTSPTFNPTGGPTDSPTSSPTAGPTGGPTAEPTAGPTGGPTAGPTAGPTGGPTAGPTAGPTGGPTAGPTATPTGTPTVSPTGLPTKEPTESPTNAPSKAPQSLERNGEDDDEEGDDMFFGEDPECPADVQVIRTVGVTEFPPVETTSVVSVISKNTDDNTVTVSLNQFWPTGSIDSIYYQWNPDYYNEKCIEESDVANGENFAEITIQCNFLKPYAKATICLEESLQDGFLQPEDDATIPKCCHDGEHTADTQVVCYTVEIQCTPGCAGEDSQQAFRRQLRGANSKN